VRIALVIEYAGNGFFGWQSQPNGKTVQDSVEAALSVIAATPTRVVCAGRTDTGVHALAQVVHFDTDTVRPLSAWVRGVNAHLPEAIAVLRAQVVADEFHARFSATGRHYRYLLLNRPQRPGLLHGKVGWYHRSLELAAMQEAAMGIIGEHDFTSFRSADCQAKSPVRTLYRLEIQREGDMLIFELHANAFLHHMVRNLVGSLVTIGSGKQQPHWLRQLVDGRDRSAAAPTFSPAGLYLTGVDYDPVWIFDAGISEKNSRSGNALAVLANA
jgi:tRNA pseudouridine38-40 synthase